MNTRAGGHVPRLIFYHPKVHININEALDLRKTQIGRFCYVRRNLVMYDNYFRNSSKDD